MCTCTRTRAHLHAHTTTHYVTCCGIWALLLCQVVLAFSLGMPMGSGMPPCCKTQSDHPALPLSTNMSTLVRCVHAVFFCKEGNVLLGFCQALCLSVDKERRYCNRTVPIHFV